MLAALNKPQLQTISGFLVDLAKLLFGSGVVGFFIPGSNNQINLQAFVIASTGALICLIFGISLLKNHD